MLETKNFNLITGAGGGAAKVPKEADDTIRTGATMRVVEILCEGPIEGFATAEPLESIYLDGTPIKSSDGTVNFKDFTYAYNLGTPTQTSLEGFDTTDSFVAVGAPLKALMPPGGGPEVSKPVTRQIDNPDVSHVILLIDWAELFIRHANGDTGGSFGEITIETRTDQTGWGIALQQRVTGKSRGPFQKSYRIELPEPPTSGPTYRQVRVTKTAGYDSGVYGSVTFGGETVWNGYTEQISTRLTYPNTAVVGFRVDAERFSSVPTRKYLMKLLKVRVPTGYDPVTRSYPTVWDGTFAPAVWTDNPAWCLYDLLLNKRYGLGDYLRDDQIDKFALYQIAKYCDELVPNGLGGHEPRFTLNCLLHSRDDALGVVRQIMSVFRGMGLWDGSQFTIVQDRPNPAITMAYTPANVEDGIFTYSGSSIKNRHTVAIVAWVDPSQGYKTAYEYVEDEEGIRRFGIRKVELTAFGCTSKAQAQRVGRWTLYSELYETDMVSFTVGLDSMLVRPGDIIKITDPTHLATPDGDGDESDRMGGRIVAGTLSQITLDAEVTLLAGETYRLMALLPDGSVGEAQCFVKGSGLTTGGTGAVIQTLGNLPAAPNIGAIWIIYRETLHPFTARVLSISNPDVGKYTITAQEYYAGKYTAIETGVKLDLPDTSNLPDPGYCPAPSNLVAQEVVYTTSTGLTFADIAVSWSAPEAGLISGYEVSYRGGKQGNWIKLPRVTGLGIDIERVDAGEYEIQLVAYNYAGKASAPVFTTTTTTGKTTPPNPPVNFTATGGVMQIQLRWGYPTDPDIKLVELWQNTVDDRASAIKLTDLAFPQDSYTHLGLGLLAHIYYWLRTRDTSGNYSEWVSADAACVKDPTVFQQLLQGAIDRSMLVQDLAGDLTATENTIITHQQQIDWLNSLTDTLGDKTDAVIEVDPGTGSYRLKAMAQINSNAAAIQTEATARANADSSMATQITNLVSVTNNLGASITSEQNARTNADTALSQQINTVSTTSANNLASVQSTLQANINTVSGNVEALYTVKIQTLTNGKKVVSGFGLRSDSTGTEFAVLADRFYVVAPGTTTLTPMFGIDNSGGSPKAIMNGDLVVVNSISASKLTAGTITADVQISTGSIQSTATTGGLPVWRLDSNGLVARNGTFSGTVQAANLVVGSGGITLMCSGIEIPATAFGQVKCQDVSGNNVISDAYHTNGAPNGPLTGTKVTFYGPLAGQYQPMRRRLRTGSVTFLAQCTAVMDHFAAIIYRLNGGAWSYLHHTVEPGDGYGAVGIQAEVTFSIDNYSTVQFGVCPTDNTMGAPTERGIIDGCLTVTAFNL